MRAYDGLYYPGSDVERHMIVWYTYSEGSNILVAASLERLLSMYKTKLSEFRGAVKIKKYFVGKFSDIPPDQKELWDEAIEKRDREAKEYRRSLTY